MSEKTAAVTFVQDEPADNIIARIKKDVANTKAGIEKALVNKHSKSSLTMREDGDITLASNTKTQMKLDNNGKSLDMTQDSITIANRRTLEVEDIVINNHKMNPQLLYYTDGVSVLDDADSYVSSFQMQGSVMVKAWDASSKKYKMIRRPANLSMFSPRLNTAQIPKDLGVPDTVKEQIEEIASTNQSVSNASEVEKATDGTAAVETVADKKSKVADSIVAKGGTPITKTAKKQ